MLPIPAHWVKMANTSKSSKKNPAPPASAASKRCWLSRRIFGGPQEASHKRRALNTELVAVNVSLLGNAAERSFPQLFVHGHDGDAFATRFLLDQHGVRAALTHLPKTVLV